VASLGAVFGIVLVASAVLTGMASPDVGLDTLWKRLCLGWVDRAAATSSFTSLHLFFVILLAALCFLAGPHSIHKVKLDAAFAVDQRPIKFTWKSLLGTTHEATRDGDMLSDIWVPFKRNDIRLDVIDGNDHYQCAVRGESLVCPPPRINADFVIDTALQNVDFTAWKPPVSEKPKASLVTYNFELTIRRLRDNVVFERFASTSSPAGLSCQILTGNATCSEVTSGEGLIPNRRNYKIELDPIRFPLNTAVKLSYRLTFNSAFYFNVVSDNICTGCDVAFMTNYPVDRYHLDMRFPSSFTWRKVTIIGAGISADRFNCTPPGAANFQDDRTTLPAKTTLIFNIFPTHTLGEGCPTAVVH